MAETSLIPKPPIAPKREINAKSNIFFNVAIVFFAISVIVAGGLFAYKSLLERQLAKNQQLLRNLEAEFSPKTIAKHEKVAHAISAVQSLLASHARRSWVFATLERNTLPTVSFISFSYTQKDNTVLLSGEAPSYQDVANQATIYQGLDSVSNATFANLALNGRGGIGFSLSIVLQPANATSSGTSTNL